MGAAVAKEYVRAQTYLHHEHEVPYGQGPALGFYMLSHAISEPYSNTTWDTKT